MVYLLFFLSNNKNKLPAMDNGRAGLSGPRGVHFVEEMYDGRGKPWNTFVTPSGKVKLVDETRSFLALKRCVELK